MIAQELEVSLHMAFVDARASRHEFITVEHLLAALLDNATAVEVLKACAVNIAELRAQLKNFINDNTPVVPGTDEVDTQPTLGFQRVIQRAIMHVQSTSNGKKEVTGANVLQDIGTSDFFFSIRCRLHMHDGALNDALKSQRWLCIHFVCTRHDRSIVINEIFQLCA